MREMRSEFLASFLSFVFFCRLITASSSLSFAELVDIRPSLSFDGAVAVEAAVEASSEGSEELEL